MGGHSISFSFSQITERQTNELIVVYNEKNFARTSVNKIREDPTNASLSTSIVTDTPVQKVLHEPFRNLLTDSFAISFLIPLICSKSLRLPVENKESISRIC